MSKNVKIIFLVATLLFLLVGVSAISASEVSDGTTVLEDTADTVASEVTTTTTDNKIVDTTTKNIKTEEQSTDLYVSDTDGSDDNSGTNDSPYKTIQKALDTTTADSTYNIHLAEGTYKGLGNTNLTVNGNYTINFIGNGNSIIDGEVNYTEHVMQDGDYYWGSSKIWEPYDNGTGNWAMKITKGDGLITISNLTIQNCWNPGGTSIEAYPTCTIDNYGNLVVNNVSFIFNHGGTGAALRNNKNATIIVNNSLFDGNRKASTTGNYGAGIYNNGTATIINSTFQNNYARWGTITNDKIMNVTNCTIRDNIAYDGASTYKTGSGITQSTSDTNYYAEGTNMWDIFLIVDGCTFIGNQQADIIGSNVVIRNSIFNKSVGIYKVSNATIHGNVFESPTPNTINTNLGSTNAPIIPLYAYVDCELYNNTLFIGDTSTSSYTIELAYNNTVYNNSFGRTVNITHQNNIFKNNSVVTTRDSYAVVVGTSGSNNTVSDNYLVSTGLVGNEAVSSNSRNTVFNNTPVTSSITVSEADFNHYFENNQLKSEFNAVETIKFNGTLSNHDLVFDLNHPVSIAGVNRNTQNYNITITIKEGTTASISSLKLNNTITSIPIVLESSGNTVRTVTIQTPNNYAIKANSNGNTITGNTLYTDIYVGNDAVSASEDNTVNSNTPTYINYLLNDDTYSQYFDSNGLIITTDLPTDIHFMIDGILSNKELIFQNNTVNITKRNDESIMYNVTITSKDTNRLILENTIINNTNGKLALNISATQGQIRYNKINCVNTTVLLHDFTTPMNNKLLIDSNIIDVTTNIKEAIRIENVYSYDNSNLMHRFYNNTINVNGTNYTAINIINSTGTILQTNNITLNGVNVTAVSIINPVKYLYNVTVNGRGVFTGTSIGNCIFNINANDTALGVLTEKINMVFGNTNEFNINSKNSAIGLKLINTTNVTGNTFYNSNGNSIGLNINSTNVTGIICDDKTSFVFDVNMTLDGDYTQAIILTNTSNKQLQGYITLYGKNNHVALIQNSTDISISRLNVNEVYNNPLEEEVILVDDSSKISITSNTIKVNSPYTINVLNCDNTEITDNYLYTPNIYGDESVISENNNELTILNNQPSNKTDYIIRESNFNDFFDENGLLRSNITDGIILQQIGDLTNKTMIINKKIEYISSTQNTLYNTTITLNTDGITLSDVILKNTDKTPLIINSNDNIINNLNISVSQIEEDITALTVNGNNNSIKFDRINVTSKKDSNINEATLIQLNGDANSIKSTTQYALLVSNQEKATLININNSNDNLIMITSTDVSYIDNLCGVLFNNSCNNDVNVSITTSYCNGTVVNLVNSSDNKIKGTYQTSYSNPSLYNINSLILSDNSNYNLITAYISQTPPGNILLINNSHNNTVKSSTITSITNETPIQIINSNGNEFLLNTVSFNNLETIAINISEGRNNNIHHNSLATKTHFGDFAVLQEVVNEVNIQNTVKDNYYQRGSGWGTSPYNPLKTILNITPVIGYVGDIVEVEIIIFARNTSYTTDPTLPVTNGTITVLTSEETINFNVTEEGEYKFNYTITDDSNQKITVEYYGDTSLYEPVSQTFNVSTSIILTDDNYSQYFTDGVLNDGITNIILGSDLHDKDLTFTRAITFDNTGNYTIYNTTVTTGGVALTNLRIINTDDRQTALIITGYGSSVTNSSITQVGDHKKTIIMKGTSQVGLLYSNITVNGTHNIIITGLTQGSAQSANSYNNIISNGNNTIIAQIKGFTALQFNNITQNSNNTNTIELSGWGGSYQSYIRANNINISGNNINAMYMNNYALGSVSGSNNINLTGSNVTAIIYKDTSVSSTFNANKIFINTDTQVSPIQIENTRLTLNNGQVIVNNTQNGIPLINVESEYPVTISNNYLESRDICGNDAVSGASTISGNKPDSNSGYKVNIEIDKDTVVLDHENTLKITLTNAYNEEITGVLTATANNQTVEIIENTITWTPTRQTFNPPTIDFQNIIENQNITTGTRLSQSTLINNTTINLPDTTSLSSTNSLYTSYGQTYLINNSVLNTPIAQQGTLYIYNCTLNGRITMTSGSPIYVDDDTIIGENFIIDSSVNVYTNNKALLEILEQKGMTPANNPQITITYTDPEGKYATTTINKTFKTTKPQLTVDPITATIGETINITARITAGDDTLTDINKGKVTFKVNGKTLKDTNGKVIYAKVINGIATIENYVVPEDWSKDGTTIQAVYSGSTQMEKMSSEKIEITLTAPEPTLTITPINDDVQTGSTVTLKAKVVIGDKAITTGKIVFKVNGKTVKDANGKVIYAKVDTNGEVSVDYTIPESFKAGTYNIEAVFTASGYDKLTSNTTMTVVKS